MMKKLLLICAFSLLLCEAGYSWGRREHATVAQIAERHLSPEAKQLLGEYLHRRPMAYYAYDAELQRDEITVTIPSKQALYVQFPHTFSVDKSMKPSHNVTDKSDRIIDNMLYHIDRLARELKANHHTMDDSVRLAQLSLLIHAVGDMRCPVHVGYEDRPCFGQYNVYFGKGKAKKKLEYHHLWDSRMIGLIHPWSYSEMAELFDIYNQKEIAKFCKGDIYVWGRDVAKCSYQIHGYGEECRIEEVDYRIRFQQMGEELMTKAGYRLAKLLNDILK